MPAEPDERWRRYSVPANSRGATSPLVRDRRMSVNNAFVVSGSDLHGGADPQLWLDTQHDVARVSRADGISDQLRIGLLANISQKNRGVSDREAYRGGLAAAQDGNRRARRIRRGLQEVLESSWMQIVSISLVLVEMQAVIFELLLEVCFLSFDEQLDPKIIEGLHYLSVSILSTFEIEFGLLFYAIGFKFCCSKQSPCLILDVIIVTAALVTELTLHGSLYKQSGKCKSNEPIDTEYAQWQIIFVVTLRIIRIVHALFTQMNRHEERITRAVAEATYVGEMRYQIRERELIHDCDSLRAELRTMKHDEECLARVYERSLAELQQQTSTTIPPLPAAAREEAQPAEPKDSNGAD